MSPFKEKTLGQKITAIFGPIAAIMAVCIPLLAWAGGVFDSNAWKDDVKKAEIRAIEQVQQVQQQIYVDKEAAKKRAIKNAIEVKTIYEKIQHGNVQSIKKELRGVKQEARQAERSDGDDYSPADFEDDIDELKDVLDTEQSQLSTIQQERAQLELQLLEVENGPPLTPIASMPLPALIAPSE